MMTVGSLGASPPGTILSISFSFERGRNRHICFSLFHNLHAKNDGSVCVSLGGLDVFSLLLVS
jgi:hypothetical protein